MKRTLLKAKKGFRKLTWEEAKLKLKRPSQRAKTPSKLKAKKPKVVTITKRKKDLWKIVSPFIRNRDLKKCFTCPREAVHAGHFLPSGNCGALLRYHPRNIHGQCYFCNINLGGNGAVYYTKMVNKYGQEYVNKLFDIKNQTTIKADEYFYLTLTDLYKQGNEEEIIKFLESYL